MLSWAEQMQLISLLSNSTNKIYFGNIIACLKFMNFYGTVVPWSPDMNHALSSNYWSRVQGPDRSVRVDHKSETKFCHVLIVSPTCKWVHVSSLFTSERCETNLTGRLSSLYVHREAFTMSVVTMLLLPLAQISVYIVVSFFFKIYASCPDSLIDISGFVQYRRPTQKN